MPSGDDTQRLVPSPGSSEASTSSHRAHLENWQFRILRSLQPTFQIHPIFPNFHTLILCHTTSSSPFRYFSGSPVNTSNEDSSPLSSLIPGLRLSNMSEQDSESELRNLQRGMEEMRQTAQRMMKQAIMERDVEIRNWLHGKPNKKRAELIYPLF